MGTQEDEKKKAEQNTWYLRNKAMLISCHWQVTTTDPTGYGNSTLIHQAHNSYSLLQLKKFLSVQVQLYF